MPDSVQYYLDEHVAHSVANGLRHRGVDVLTVAAAGMLQASDVEHLRFAHLQSRVIFSQDADFLRLHAAGHSHSGIVYSSQQTPIGQIVAGLMLIFELMTPDDMAGHVEFI